MFPYFYRDAPLKLEWAPGNILEPKTLPDNNEKKSDVGGNDVRRVNLEQQVEIDPDVTEIKSLRLPKMNIGQYAGFAFVEFMTKQEDSNAKNSLSSTHFYGRHLVLEWANDDITMEAIRARSAAKYMDQENNNPKKRKSSTVLDESRMKFERIAE